MAKRTEKAQAESDWLSRSLHLYGRLHRIEVPPGPGAAARLDRVCREAEEQAWNEDTGARVNNANPGGRPDTISDEELAKRWTETRNGPIGVWNPKNEAISKQVQADLEREGITLTSGWITKKVRTYLQECGQWPPASRTR